MDKQQLYQELKQYLLQKDIVRAAVFGSFARNEETDQSDIDLLVEVKGMTMFDILRLEDELQFLCKRKIDLVEYKAIKPSIHKYVFSNLVQLI